ncbi:hypothetical protein BD309DRAFT_947700 [Dichomitus squalens]|uniref:Uncharacterized protein n=1 Tax=Dichomitus squalens TaxID=114155 RepID=A0A4Q9MRL5_9APHY|nr:hypothetical protein BD311DRAFT_755845 [Dichomitus squalens]TBU49266.1 hypothetical protein BD309DRAFT_947700 [Dichomitus squalens]
MVFCAALAASSPALSFPRIDFGTEHMFVSNTKRRLLIPVLALVLVALFYDICQRMVNVMGGFPSGTSLPR